MTRPVQHLANAVVLSGPALADTYYLICAGIRYTRRNGYTPDRFRALQNTLGAAAAAAHTGHRDDAPTPTPAHSPQEDLIGAQEAAHMLGLSKRQVQRIARSLDGRLAGGRWVFDRAAVAAYHAHRKDTAA